MLQQTVRILKALGEPTRLTIIKFLSEQELCICELTAILDMSQPRVSQHVNVLKKAGLVKERKFKQKSYLSINPTVLNGILIEPFKSFLQSTLDVIPELDAACQRYKTLDSNEAVQDCKNESPATDIELKWIS